MLMAKDMDILFIICCGKFLKNVKDFFYKYLHLFLHQKYFLSAYCEVRNHSGHLVI